MNQLIAAPDPDSPFFARDVAILELLYSSGLRASERSAWRLSRRKVSAMTGKMTHVTKGVNYSARSALAGSILVAPRAGMYAAMTVMARSTSDTPISVRGSDGLTSKRSDQTVWSSAGPSSLSSAGPTTTWSSSR